MPSYSEESAKAFNMLKDLKGVSQQLDKELQRYLQQSGEKTCWLNIQRKICSLSRLYPEYILEED